MVAFNVETLQQAEQQGIKLENAVHLTNSLKDLRALPAGELMKYQARYAPIVDGYVLPEPVSQLFAEGKQNNVPVITGWNADDALIGSFLTRDAYLKTNWRINTLPAPVNSLNTSRQILMLS